MKKIYLLLLFFVGLLSSCQKEDLSSVNNETDKLSTVAVEDAQMLLDESYSENSINKSTLKPWISTYSNKAYYEPLKGSKEKILIVPAHVSNSSGYSRVVMIERNEQIEAVVFTMFFEGPEEGNFTGKIAVQDLKGNFLRGFRVENGKMVSKLVPGKSRDIHKNNDTDWNLGELGEVYLESTSGTNETYIYIIYDDTDYTNPHAYEPEWNYLDAGESGGGGESKTTTEEEDAAAAFEEKIDDSNLDPCLQKIIEELKKTNKGVGEIILKFSGNIPGFNWEVKDGNLILANASTSQNYNATTGTVTTTFDPTKFSSASNLSAARTVLHESVHAYIVASFGTDYINSSKTFADFFADYNQQKYPTRNDTDHAEFVRNYVQDIAIALEQFGTNQGLSLTPQFYTDLAWGGLTEWPKRDSQGRKMKDSYGNDIYEETPWFIHAYPNSTDRNRIKNNILIEQTGKDKYGNPKSQKGNSVGC